MRDAGENKFTPARETDVMVLLRAASKINEEAAVAVQDVSSARKALVQSYPNAVVKRKDCEK